VASPRLFARDELVDGGGWHLLIVDV
jgi:hypothetical protein